MAITSATGPIRTTGVESPRSDVPQQVQPDLAGVSTATPTSPKRGRGRPPKAKSGSNQNDSVRRVSGRPKKNGAPAATTGSIAAAVKSNRTRPKRSNPPPAAASRVTADASRKRGRPKRDDVAAATVPATKRGRKPKVQVAAVNSAGRTSRKSSSVAPVAANVGDLKKKTALLQKKVKEAAAKLKIAVTAIEAVEAIASGM